jgi:cell wall-associated NlpC family hydrolase
MRRIAALCSLLAALAAAPAVWAETQPVLPAETPPAETPPAESQPAEAPPGEPQPSWAQAQIEVVVAAGLMAPSVAEFRPDDPLTRAELAQVLSALMQQEVVLSSPERLVTLQELDTRLVRLLGLGPAAKQIRSGVGAAGLKPPGRLGTETVARLVGLRTNHPYREDYLELLPNDPVTRAETAFSVARVLDLRLAGADFTWVNDLAATFVLPEMSDWQRQILRRAVRFVGYPYVWGGSSEKEQKPFEVTVPGGFDCSGFVWRVFKTKPFADAPLLAEALQGRTTYQMSGEIMPDARVPLEALQPGDILFFGTKSLESTPEEIIHMGIYLGGGWFVHSSRYGTTMHPLADWYATSFAWGRRVLVEAGLS